MSEELKEKPLGASGQVLQKEAYSSVAQDGCEPATEMALEDPAAAGSSPAADAAAAEISSRLPTKGLDDRFSMRIPAIHDAQHTAVETHGHGHWKVTVLKFIHSDIVQNILMGLLMLDVVILFIELFLTGYYPPCHIIERDAISCCYSSAENSTDAAASGEYGHDKTDHNTHFLRFLADAGGSADGVEGDDGHGHGHHNLCEVPSMESHEFEAACDPHKWTVVHKVEGVLFVFTISILVIFLVELIIMAIALGKSFFKQFFYVLDLWIVSTSLALEIIFVALHEEYLIALTGVLLFGRVWRFVRIGHGLIEVTAEYAAKDKVVLWHYAETLEQILKENNIALPEKSKHVVHITKHLSHHSSGGEH